MNRDFFSDLQAASAEVHSAEVLPVVSTGQGWRFCAGLAATVGRESDSWASRDRVGIGMDEVQVGIPFPWSRPLPRTRLRVSR